MSVAFWHKFHDCIIWVGHMLTRHKGGVLGNNIPSVSHFFWKRPFFEVCKLDQSIFWVSVIHQTFYLSSSKSCYNHTNLISNLILIDCIFDPHGLFFQSLWIAIRSQWIVCIVVLIDHRLCFKYICVMMSCLNMYLYLYSATNPRLQSRGE